MKYSFYILIISILFSLVLNVSFDPVLLPFEVNNGEIKNVTVLVKTIWIYTKINKNSQIIMDITCHDNNIIIKKEDIRYGKYFKDTNKTELAPISLYVHNGNKYKITYDVLKEQNDYGVLEITNLSFNQKLTIEVTIISRRSYWLIIIGYIALGIILLIVIFLICRSCLRCCHKGYR